MFDVSRFIRERVPLYNPTEQVEQKGPIRMDVDRESREFRLLFLDDVYDVIYPVYQAIQDLREFIIINGINGLEWIRGVLSGFVVSLYNGPIRVGVCVSGLLLYLAIKGVSIGKFTYTRRGAGTHCGLSFGTAGTYAHELSAE